MQGYTEGSQNGCLVWEIKSNNSSGMEKTEQLNSPCIREAHAGQKGWKARVQ